MVGRQMNIRIAQVKENTQAEGPGNRFALWVQGCSIRCTNCCNPEMFKQSGGQQTSTSNIIQQIKSTPNIEGISILGGEPLDQIDATLDICKQAKALNLSVMLYTGYTLEEIKIKFPSRLSEIMTYIDLIVDGRYEHTKPERTRRWVGSSNQIMHFLSNRYQQSDPQFYVSNTVEISFNKNTKVITVNGFPHQQLFQLRKAI